MYNTSNLKLYQTAKQLSRELRKSQTHAELIFWQNVRNKRFHGLKFFRQYPIFYDLDNIESFFIADFFCFKKRTIIEIDGKIHNFKKKKDRLRTDILNLIGLRVIRFYNEDVENDIENVLNELLNMFEMIDTE